MTDAVVRAAIVLGAWRKLAENFGIGSKAATRVHAELAASLPSAIALVERSPLPAPMRDSYCTLLRERSLL